MKTLNEIAHADYSLHFSSPDGASFASDQEALDAIYAYAPHTRTISANWGEATDPICVTPTALTPAGVSVATYRHDPHAAARSIFSRGSGYWVIAANYNRDAERWEYSVQGEYEREA